MDYSHYYCSVIVNYQNLYILPGPPFKGLPEELQAEMMMIAILGIVLGVMTVLLAGIFYVRRKEHKEKRTVTNHFNVSQFCLMYFI